MAIAIVLGGKNVIWEKNAKISFTDTDGWKKKKILKIILDNSVFSERS